MFKGCLLFVAFLLPLAACQPELSEQEKRLVSACVAAAETGLASKISTRNIVKSYEAGLYTSSIDGRSALSKTWVIVLKAEVANREKSQSDITCTFFRDNNIVEFAGFNIRAKNYKDINMAPELLGNTHVPIKGKVYFAAQEVLGRDN